MKTDQEVQEYFHKTAYFSFNGVLDDFVFGDGREWYVLVPEVAFPATQPEPYVGPFKSYDEANDYRGNNVTGYINTDK